MKAVSESGGWVGWIIIRLVYLWTIYFLLLKVEGKHSLDKAGAIHVVTEVGPVFGPGSAHDQSLNSSHSSWAL